MADDITTVSNNNWNRTNEAIESSSSQLGQTFNKSNFMSGSIISSTAATNEFKQALGMLTNDPVIATASAIISGDTEALSNMIKGIIIQKMLSNETSSNLNEFAKLLGIDATEVIMSIGTEEGYDWSVINDKLDAKIAEMVTFIKDLIVNTSKKITDDVKIEINATTTDLTNFIAVRAPGMIAERTAYWTLANTYSFQQIVELSGNSQKKMEEDAKNAIDDEEDATLEKAKSIIAAIKKVSDQVEEYINDMVPKIIEYYVTYPQIVNRYVNDQINKTEDWAFSYIEFYENECERIVEEQIENITQKSGKIAAQGINAASIWAYKKLIAKQATEINEKIGVAKAALATAAAKLVGQLGAVAGKLASAGIKLAISKIPFPQL